MRFALIFNLNKKVFQSNAKHLLADKVLGCIMNKLEQVGGGLGVVP